MKKTRWLILAVFLGALTLLTSCKKEVTVPENVYYMHDEKPEVSVLQTEKPDAKAIYEKTVCTPEMLFGEYTLKGGSEELEKYSKEMDYIDFRSENYEKITAIPYAISGLPEKTFEFPDENGVKTPEYMMSLSFRSDNGMPVMKEAICKVNGNTVSFCLAEVETVGDYIAYTLTDMMFIYTFELRGMDLTLTSGDKSVELTSNCMSATPKKFFGDVYLASDEGIDSIYRIFYRWQEDGDTAFTCYDRDGNKLPGAYGMLYEDGGFVLGQLSDDGWTSKPFAYYYTVSGGLILTDGEKTYHYTDDLSAAYMRRLKDNLDEEEPGEVTEETVKKRDELVADLVKALNDNGVEAAIDTETGELSIGAGFLFKGDSSDITSEGKTVLSNVMRVYTDTVSKEEYRDFVVKILVEGHTAPIGSSSLEGGYQLSQERADKTAAYILSEESGLSKEARELLAKLVKPVGVSCSRPVLDASGNVDMAASRRVSFRLTIRAESAQ